MIPAQKNKKRTTGGWHKKKSAVCENVIPKFARSIFPPDWVNLSIVVSIQNAQI